MVWAHAVMVSTLASVIILAALPVAQTAAVREYVDARRGFQFSYPAAFGTAVPGTNDGFGDRVAAVRFSVFSVLGGEAALTRGAPVLDMQAAGGLYDAMTLEAFPEALRRRVVSALPRLTPANLCGQLGAERHLDPESPVWTSLTADQRTAIALSDQMRNAAPKIIQCTVDGTTVSFDKEVSFQPGWPRQHVYGAVRFLDPPYSTFQIIRAGAAPSASVLAQMKALVNSWRSR